MIKCFSIKLRDPPLEKRWGGGVGKKPKKIHASKNDTERKTRAKKKVKKKIHA